jgi:antimicrobial peptide system SdpB family protein
MLLASIGRRVAASLDELNPFTEVYGIGRSLLALATALTFAFSRSDVLFRAAAGIPDVPICTGVRATGLFCLVGAAHLELARWLTVFALLFVASGYRPRFTGLLHAWLAFSFQANAMVIEGGDQIAAILSLLLVPVTLLDDRKWHWLPPTPRPLDARERKRRLVARACFLLIRVQVAGIYFHASIAKFAVAEWTDGTVLYYWLNHPTFGMPTWIRPLVEPLLLSGYAVGLLTWSVLLLEWALSAGLLVDRRYRPILLVLGILLHAGIAVVHGLVSFAMIMFAALILYLRPLDRPFGAVRVFDWLSARLQRLRRAAHP